MKSGFQTVLDVRLKEGSDCVWIVVSPLKYLSELLNRLITVPTWYEIQSDSSAEGDPPLFETDFASVPRIPVFYEMWGDRAHREAVLHDYLYRIDSIPVATYSQANSVFLEAMQSTGKPWRIRYPMYWGVVLGGWTAYHKKRVRDKL
jgi:hypothetical protein